MIDKKGYRLNVGIIITNQLGQLFWGKRPGNGDAWQFPQGGVQPYETLEETMFRELGEEVGLTEKDVEIVVTNRHWLYYDLPVHMLRYFKNPLCIGQKQRWFLLKLTSCEENICLDRTTPAEFAGWRWVEYWHPLKQVIYFKREVYREVLHEFAPHVRKLAGKN